MPHHTTEAECYEEKVKAAQATSNVTRVTAAIGIFMGLIVAIVAATLFLNSADNKSMSRADTAHLRIDTLKEDVQKIDKKMDKLIRVVTRRLPSDDDE